MPLPGITMIQSSCRTLSLKSIFPVGFGTPFQIFQMPAGNVKGMQAYSGSKALTIICEYSSWQWSKHIHYLFNDSISNQILSPICSKQWYKQMGNLRPWASQSSKDRHVDPVSRGLISMKKIQLVSMSTEQSQPKDPLNRPQLQRWLINRSVYQQIFLLIQRSKSLSSKQELRIQLPQYPPQYLVRLGYPISQETKGPNMTPLLVATPTIAKHFSCLLFIILKTLPFYRVDWQAKQSASQSINMVPKPPEVTWSWTTSRSLPKMPVIYFKCQQLLIVEHRLGITGTYTFLKISIMPILLPKLQQLSKGQHQSQKSFYLHILSSTGCGVLKIIFGLTFLLFRYVSTQGLLIRAMVQNQSAIILHLWLSFLTNQGILMYGYVPQQGSLQVIIQNWGMKGQRLSNAVPQIVPIKTTGESQCLKYSTTQLTD